MGDPFERHAFAPDLINVTLMFCSEGATLGSARVACRAWRECASDDDVWKAACALEFGLEGDALAPDAEGIAPGKSKL